MAEFERTVRAGARWTTFADQNSSRRTTRSTLLLGVAFMALLAGARGASADGLTFDWTGNSNGTSFGVAGNFGTGYDADGNPAYDVDGNPIPGPPSGSDNMNVTSGTPNISSKGRHISSLELSGGEFIVRNSTVGGPSTFFVDDTLNLSGTGAIELEGDYRGPSVLTVNTMNMTGGTVAMYDGPGVPTDPAQLPGPGMLTVTNSFSQSAGDVSQVTINTPSYYLSGGTLASTVDFGELFALSGSGTVEGAAVLNGADGSTMEQSGGIMDGTVSGIASYTQSGGSLGGIVTTGTYDLTDASATSTGGTIDASNLFALEPADGTATVDARLTGTGQLVKSGASTVVLTNGGNDFTGGVAIDAGTLQVLDDALPQTSAVSVGDGATLQMTTAGNVVFMGTMSGGALDTGALVKDGLGTLTLGGDVTLGGLSVDAGELDIGTGTSTNTASFESATIAANSTLYVAAGATLVIRIPDNITNNGHLINDGTVDDDLANTNLFDNNHNYNANVASNTGTINNNTPGVWTGNVLTNSGYINNNAGAMWDGDIRANSGLITNAAGATWTGDVVTNVNGISNQGTWVGDAGGNGAGHTPGWIYNTGAAATWTGDVIDNNSQIVNVNGATWTGDVNGNNNAIFNMDDSFWVGDVVADGGGSNNLAQIDNYGTWTGDVDANAAEINNLGGEWHGNVEGNAGVIVNNYNDDITNVAGVNAALWSGDVNGNTGLIVNDHAGLWNGAVNANSGNIANQSGSTWTGEVVTNGSAKPSAQILNYGTWNGSVAANSGTVTNSGLWTGDVLSNAGTIKNTATWTGDFTSAGTVYARGTINGDFANSGLLQLTGSLSGIGLLTNDGTLEMGSGAANVLSAANASFGADSVYGVDVSSSGSSDELSLSGSAALAGTVRVTATSGGGAYDDSTTFTILTAAGGLGGTTFDDVTTNLAFLAPRLSYDADDVYLMLKRNDVGFGDVGVTANQKAIAAAAESLGVGNPIYDSVLWLSDDQARQAFDQLAGEGFGATETAFVQNANLLADTMAGHLDHLFDVAGVEGGAASAYAEGPATAAVPWPQSKPGAGVWGQLYGARGSISDTAEASGLNSTTGGFAGGMDGLVGDWRLGLMLHAGATATEMAAVNSSSRSTDYGLGVYGGTQWGDTRLSLGAGYTRHDIHSTRQVAFPGFDDNLSADYAANSVEAFGKLSHNFDLGAVSLAPYASLAYVLQSTDGFAESGGAAAISSEGSTVNATFTTLGTSLDRKFAVGDGMLLTVTGGLGWRHAMGAAPDDVHALAGGTSFSVQGTPFAGDTAVLDAALNLDISANNKLDLSYSGQVGTNSQTHGLSLTWGGGF